MKSKLVISIALLLAGTSTALIGPSAYAKDKAVTIPKILRGNWVNQIEYKYHKGKFYRQSYMYTQVTKHYVISSRFQSDAYGTKVVSYKKVKNSKTGKRNIYRLKATDITLVPVKKHTYHYVYMRRITVGKKHFLSVAFKLADLDQINSMYGNAKDNGLNKDFQTPKK
ncbi:hypothetical protein IV54_GL000054 [Levilactobacillus paucivorans]|uniref:Uncharacterized protein n=1 Tax=Levilactobacillus paucivorans TaxID=616990 RepID=A0A0R2LPF7_9LACO|nr:hypothetical protein [Levilactobacillus paucivorans]KRO03604.1 hypothetical protein IV54_GL000054 [Levilactobacillus paucivorans]